MLEVFVPKTFRPQSEDLLGHAWQIIQDYQAQGYALTLRQLYYQFVARDILPNTEASYKNLGKLVSDGRLAGYLSWEAIEDRTRKLEQNTHWESPAELLDICVKQYRIDKWLNQVWAPEVWIEKEALVGVIEPACRALDVPWFACRGYTSQSEAWRAGHRMRRYRGEGRVPVIFYLGDHDPSGIDMTRDVRDRLEMFTQRPVEVVRLALNMDQVEQYGPPPNPAKMTDSRFGWYVEQYGESCWELDALNPNVIDELVRNAVLERCDEDLWRQSREEEEHGRQQIANARDAM